jgi:hypothetical protein
MDAVHIVIQTNKGQDLVSRQAPAILLHEKYLLHRPTHVRLSLSDFDKKASQFNGSHFIDTRKPLPFSSEQQASI